MRSLGVAWRLGSQACFDIDLARSTLAWFDSRTVPRVADPPIDVRQVKFISDLQNTDPPAKAELALLGPLAAAFLRQD